MFRRSSQRQSPLERVMIDDMLLAYVEWREECGAVWQVYERWTAARSSEQAALAHAAYSAALDREEAAARVYGEVREALGKLLNRERHPRPVARGAPCR